MAVYLFQIFVESILDKSHFRKKYLEDYAASHGLSNCRHYTDDGWSGGNFERPAWKQMIADIEAGMVGTVLVKDLSRAGRDYLQTGFYTEVFFRQHGVHFIAIANNVDSDDQNSSEFAPFLNIMKDIFIRDTQLVQCDKLPILVLWSLLLTRT